MSKYWLTGCLCAAMIPAVVLAQAPAHRIEVLGSGEVTAPADELTLAVEIITNGKDFAAVKQRNDLLLRQLLELAATHQLPKPAVESTTASFDFSPDPSGSKFQRKGNNNMQRSKGDDPFAEPGESRPPLRLSRRLTLRFEKLTSAAELLTKLTAHEAVHESHEVRLSSLQTNVKDAASHQSKARRLAVQQAKEKAVQLADAADLQLGAAVSIVEDRDFSPPGPFRPMSDPFGRHSSPVRMDDQHAPFSFVAFQNDDAALAIDQLSPATIRISVSVRIVYEAKPKPAK